MKREEEITFDRAARTEYLTGFHKRKLQRIKAAKETAAAIEKQAKAEAKKQVCGMRRGRGLSYGVTRTEEEVLLQLELIRAESL